MKLLLTLILPLVFHVDGGSIDPKPEVRFEGLKIWVTDLTKAKDFYEGVLGFETKMINQERAVLQTGSFPIHLVKADRDNLTNYELHERTGLSIQVSKLLPAIDELRKQGVRLLDHHLQRNGVGISIPFKDPFGNLLSLMEVQIREVPDFDGFQVYNTGITSSNMDKAINFYEKKLGFEEWSRNYLPQALPLKHEDGSFAFMLHYKPNLQPHSRQYGRDSEINLLLSTPNLTKLKSYLKDQGSEFIFESDKSLALYDPFGNICEIIEK